jgi:5'-phosphate synthase pdxT subunit
MPRPIIGVLALQGCVQPHLAHLAAAGADARAIHDAQGLARAHAVILPGGESTAWLRLLAHTELWEPLRAFAAGRPIWGVCAGAILLAREVRAPQPSLGLIDIAIARNAYGRQQDSFHATVDGCEVAFIRAPRVVECGAGVEVRACHGGDPIFVAQGARWATTFHPELSAERPSPFHMRFVALAARGERLGGRGACGE